MAGPHGGSGCHWRVWRPVGTTRNWDCIRPGSNLPNDILNVFFDVPRALAFGVAALWLLAPYVGHRQRFRAFLLMLLILAVFGVFSFAVAAGWDEGAAGRIAALSGSGFAVAVGWAEGPVQMMVLTLLALVITAAMVLSGFACRGHYRPIRLCLWLFLSLLAVLIAVPAVLYFLFRMASPGNVNYAPFLGIGLLMVAVTFATLLPFLVLSLTNALFRERLKNLFHLESQKPILNKNKLEAL